MKKIKEIIVVEGISDKNHLLNLVDADILVCNGSAVDGFDMDYLKTLSETRGIIILTDPDFPGEKIRRYLSSQLRTCKHAFVDKKKSIKHKKVGVAECEGAEILRALENVVTFDQSIRGNLTNADMYSLKLIGHNESVFLRKKIAQKFNLGKSNGKTLLNRLNLLNISKELLQEAIDD